MICSDDKNIKLHRFTCLFYGLYCTYCNTFRITKSSKQRPRQALRAHWQIPGWKLCLWWAKKRDFIYYRIYYNARIMEVQIQHHILIKRNCSLFWKRKHNYTWQRASIFFFLVLSVAGCYMNLDLYNQNNFWLMTMLHLLNGLPSAASNSPATKTKNHTYNT